MIATLRKFPLVLFLFLTTTQLEAQDPEFKWADIPMEGDGSAARNITRDPDGNIYVTGEQYSGNSKLFIAKYSKDGDLIWNKTVERVGESGSIFPKGIVLAPTGAIYVAGSFSGTFDFNPGPGTNHLSGDDGKLFVLRLNSSGDYRWARDYFPANNTSTQYESEEIYALSPVRVTTGDLLMVTWRRTVDTDQQEMLSGRCTLSLINGNNGNFSFSRVLSQESGILGWHSVDSHPMGFPFGSATIDNEGNTYIWGNFEGTIDLDPAETNYHITATPTHNEFLVKWSLSGNFVWGKLLEKTERVTRFSLKTDRWGNLYRIGHFGGTVDFDPGPGTFELTAMNQTWGSTADFEANLFIAKHNRGGDFDWARQVGGVDAGIFLPVVTGAKFPAIDASGNIHIWGSFSGSIDFDPGEEVFEMQHTAEERGFWLKLDGDGKFQWVKRTGYEMYDLDIDPSGDVHLAGAFDKTVEMNLSPGQSRPLIHPSSSGYMGLVANYRTQGNNCLTSGISLYDQDGVDNFAANYPGCLHLGGGLRIDGSRITNLNGLSHIKSIGGDLTIIRTSLTSLTGLESLTYIEGDVVIYGGQTSLTSLVGLENLVSIGGSLAILNRSLTSLTGLDKLSAIGGSLNIGSHQVGTEDLILTSLTGLDELRSIGGSLDVYRNPTLTSLRGLEKLTSIGGSLFINNNATLTSLTGLENLTFAGSLNVSNNGALSSLTGLESLTAVKRSFVISNNLALTSLAALENLTSVGTTIEISGIALVSLMGLDKISSISGNLSISGNTALTSLTGLRNLTSVGTYIVISNNAALTSLIGLENLTSAGTYFYIRNNAALTSLTGLGNLASIGEHFHVHSNPVLTSLRGLEKLTSIGSTLHIYDNPELTSFEGLDNLISIGLTAIFNNEWNRIYNNPSLVSLTGLEKLESIRGRLYIDNNVSLTTLDGLGGRAAGAPPSGRVSAPPALAGLTITNNPQLSSCAVKLVVDHLLVEGPTIIANNGPDGNCNTAEAILADWESALPVTLTTFTGQYVEGSAQLSWTTTDEVSFSRFELQKSTNGLNFTTAGSIPAKGSDSRYRYFLPQPEAVAYYRLRMIDLDGTFAYSHLVSVRHDNMPEVKVFPNPVADRLFLAGLKGDEVLEVSVIDMNGRRWYRGAYNAAKGIGMGDKPAGLYLVKVVEEDGVQRVYRVIKSAR